MENPHKVQQVLQAALDALEADESITPESYSRRDMLNIVNSVESQAFYEAEAIDARRLAAMATPDHKSQHGRCEDAPCCGCCD
jgi:hypothetical protein